MDLDFLEKDATADSTASLVVLLPDGSVTHIHNVSPFTVLDKCPLLFHAFEFCEYTESRQASIEATSRSAVVSLLKYLYTGTYLTDPEASTGYLLLHAEAFKIAEDFDVPEFQVQAYVNFTRETEFSCSNATSPSDLCETIKFLYNHLASQQSQQQQSLIDTILNYCLSVFKYQGLGEREDFRQTVFDNPDFHQDLCRISMRRDFEDEGAMDIVQLPVCRPTPYSKEALLKRTLAEIQYELWQETEDLPMEDNEAESCPSPSKKRCHGSFTLVHRPKSAGEAATSSEGESEPESSSDESGFTLVHRPKIEQDPESSSDSASASGDSPIQSPNISPFVEAELESQSEYADSESDGDWENVQL